eukprot:450626-Prorocentrum_minimum.AAC.1
MAYTCTTSALSSSERDTSVRRSARSLAAALRDTISRTCRPPPFLPNASMSSTPQTPKKRSAPANFAQPIRGELPAPPETLKS